MLQTPDPGADTLANPGSVRQLRFWPASFAGLPPPRAGNGTRTRDPNLGKVVLYQLSYSREAVRILAPDPPRRNDPVPGHARLKGAVEARGIEPLTS